MIVQLGKRFAGGSTWPETAERDSRDVFDIYFDKFILTKYAVRKQWWQNPGKVVGIVRI